MTPTIAATESSLLLAQLATITVRSVMLAAVAGLLLKIFRVRATSTRLFAWTAVLYGALALPVLGWLLPPLAVPMPFVAAKPISARSVSATAVSLAPTPRRTAAQPNPLVARTDRPLLAAASQATWPSFWTSLWSFRSAFPAAIYLIVALIFLARFAIGIVYARRLVRRSKRIHDSRVTLRLASRAHASGLRLIPQAHESDLISVPVTVGALNSTILLPGDWRGWDDANLDSVIAHEMSHVARGDALTQRLSLLYRAVFWFSPLAWWLDRQLANLAEQASDEAALSGGADRNQYARTLLAFFEALQATPGRVWWQGVSIVQQGQAERRLETILAWRGAVTMGLKKSVLIAIVICAVPVVFLAASVRPVAGAWEFSNVARSQEPATAASAPARTVPPAPAVAPVGGVTSVAPTAGVAAPAPTGVITGVPTAPAAPDAPFFAGVGQSQESEHGHNHGYHYAYGFDDEQRFVIVSGKTDTFTMSGSSEDARHVEKLRKQISGDFIWFQRDEKSYLIRDQATIDRARKLWEPQNELGKKQEELGRQQEALGKQQEELGARMEQIQVKVPDMTAELDKLKAELKQFSAGATTEQIGRIQSEIGELQSKIGEIQSHAGDQQGKLGEEMGTLGEKQGKLGQQQGELGRQQGELAEKASREMRTIFDEAIKNGTAKPEPESNGSGTL